MTGDNSTDAGDDLHAMENDKTSHALNIDETQSEDIVEDIPITSNTALDETVDPQLNTIHYINEFFDKVFIITY